MSNDDLPLFVRLARELVDDIRRGRFSPGTRLPSSRQLAAQLGVHRNTVLAAIEELKSQGWVTSRRGAGCFVSRELPERPSLAGTSVGPVRPFGAPLARLPWLGSLQRSFDAPQAKVLFLSAGTPDPRLVPVEALSRAWRRVVKRGGRRLLEYGHPAGHEGLRAALAHWVASLRGVAARAENVLVTRGSQMALDVCARALVRPGDVVAVEALGYRPAWDALRLAGATLVPVPVDREGLRVDVLAGLGALRAVYTTPHHQYPTTVTMSAARRLELLALAKRRRFVILEDDYDHEFHYEGRPVLPLAAADQAGLVVYLGTLSKVLAPGLRLGFVVAPADFVARLVALRSVMDRQGDHPMEAAVAELIEDGELQRHIRKMRVAYAARRGALVTGLSTHLGDALEFDVPKGGISVWARWRGARAAFDAWVRASLASGVAVTTGAHYAFAGAAPCAVRLVFSRHSPAELTRAAQVLGASLGST